MEAVKLRLLLTSLILVGELQTADDISAKFTAEGTKKSICQSGKSSLSIYFFSVCSGNWWEGGYQQFFDC